MERKGVANLGGPPSGDKSRTSASAARMWNELSQVETQTGLDRVDRCQKRPFWAVKSVS